MIECPKCENDETFFQLFDGYRRNIHIFAERGNIRAERGVWKANKQIINEGFTCAKCGTTVTLGSKLVKTWRLDDRPIETARSIDLDAVLAGLHNMARGAELTVREEDPRPSKYVDFDSLKLKLPKLLRSRIEDGIGVSLSHLYSHQAEALKHAFAGKNVVLQTPTASGKSL
jgi:hypothetical protein